MPRLASVGMNSARSVDWRPVDASHFLPFASDQRVGVLAAANGFTDGSSAPSPIPSRKIRRTCIRRALCAVVEQERDCSAFMSDGGGLSVAGEYRDIVA